MEDARIKLIYYEIHNLMKCYSTIAARIGNKDHRCGKYQKTKHINTNVLVIFCYLDNTDLQ
jgi:hypothetical protein